MGCRRVAPRRTLVRFVAGPDGPVPGHGLGGRGAWVCPEESCALLACRRGGLARGLRLAPDVVAEATDRVVEAVRRTAPG